MRAINHALTGAVIGLAVGEPLIAVPVAFLSHFVCDMIPHYGPSQQAKSANLTSKVFKWELRVDALLCVLLVAVLFALKPDNWLLASICAFVATSPDFLWLRTYRDAQSGKSHKVSKLEKLLSDIQWFERPSGILVEIAWLALFVCLLVALI